MDIRTGSIDFSSPLRGSGPRTGSASLVFPRPVARACVGITGYSLGYAPPDDHHVGRLELTASERTEDNVVIVDATLGVRDWSGNWDDNYQGFVDFVVLAELDAPGTLPPRGDVEIVDMELNQAVQFFRAATYLDAVHALPDNAIWLVARKNAGVRVYVDYDASAGLPPISGLTGSLEVETATGTLTLQPINGAPIAPRPDSTINMALADHTLNFMIPAAWCDGTLTVSCQVWDAADPGPRSAAFTRTLVFTDVAPLDIYVVGVNYTANGGNLAAPTQAQFTTQMLPLLLDTYPIGDVVQSGYTSIAFGETVTGMIGGSCTDGFKDLLDRLSDLRGGSSDVYVGVLPAGIVFATPGNEIGGCGRGGLAACFLDYPPDLPHEVGHAFGRQHAPCSPSGRCRTAPANVDPFYPQYGTFPSDSIGVFGFDPTTNTVFNPAGTFDFMSYSTPKWVSAYTYMALRGAFPATGGPGGGGSGPHHLAGRQGEYLHLGLSIARDRTVERRPSFHHPGYGSGAAGCDELTVELLDGDGAVLLCTSLACGCEEGGCDCWPRTIRDTVPWPPGVRTLVVWEGPAKLYEEDVPDPPKVRITAVREHEQGVELRWSVSGEGARSKDLWCIVHWYDPVAEVWRGVAPRQQEHALVVPRELFRQGRLCVRVLATSGIATGFAQRALELSGHQPGPAPTEVVLAGPATGAAGAGSVLRAIALDASGRELPDATIVWYDDAGAEVGRGSQLDMRPLGHGQHVVRAVARHADGFAAKGCYATQGPSGVEVHHELREPASSAKPPHVHPHPRPPRPAPADGPCPPAGEGGAPDDHAQEDPD